VRIMEKIIRSAEQAVLVDVDHLRRRQDVETTVAMATVRAAAYAADITQARLIAVYTETGTTARLLAGERPSTPVVAFTPSARTMGKLSLVWGTMARKIPPGRTSHDLTVAGDRILRDEKLTRKGDRVVQIAGTVRQSGLTNAMSIREL